MTRILSLVVAAAALSLASCAAIKKDSCEACCSAPGKEKACCTSAHAKGAKCETCEAPKKK
jgi:hypothetical protein